MQKDDRSTAAAAQVDAETESDQQARHRAQFELAERLENAVAEFLRAEPGRRWLIPRSCRVLIDKLRRRSHRRMERTLLEWTASK